MDFEERVRTGFAKQSFMATLRAELIAVSDGACAISIPHSAGVTQQHGLFHGGVTASLADTAAGFAGFSQMEPDRQPLTVEFKISFLAPARGDRLEARARVVGGGRRVKHVVSEVFSLEGGEEQMVALALVTITATRAVSEI